MSKVYVRDGVSVIVYNERTLTHEALHPGRSFDADDPFVADHAEYFTAPVEQATAAPGETRSTRRRAS